MRVGDAENTNDSHPDLQSPAGWQSAIEATGPASLLIVIDVRLGDLRRTVPPEDILQEAMLHAWTARHSVQWRGHRAFRAWVLTIIDRCIADARTHILAAKRGSGKTICFQACGGAIPGFEPVATTTPSRVATLNEQAATMRSALDALPEDIREIVRLRLFEQESMPRIAELVGLPLSTVEHRVRRGSMLYQSRLRSILARSAVIAPDHAAKSVSSRE